MTDEVERIAIVARNENTYKQWCHDNDRNPRDWKLTQLVTSVDRLRGSQFHRAIWLSTPSWWSGSTVDEVRANLRVCVRLGDNPRIEF